MSESLPVTISELVINGFKCIPNWNSETEVEILGEGEQGNSRPIKAKDLYRFKDLGNFIVITGNNASGKSTMIQAIFLILGSALKILEEVQEYEITDQNEFFIQAMLSLAYKYMGLQTKEDLKYLFHKIKAKVEKIGRIFHESKEIYIRLVIHGYDNKSVDLELTFTKNKKNEFEIKISGISSLEEFSPEIGDIYVFYPLYPGNAQNHSGIFSAKGLGEIDIPIDLVIEENKSLLNNYSIGFQYRLTGILGRDKKLPFPSVPIQYIPLGAYAKSRLDLVKEIQRIKRRIHGKNRYSEILNIYVFEEPEIGLHPILQRKFIRELYDKFFENKEENEKSIIIISTQSDHILNESIKLANELKDNKYFVPTFIDCCQQIVRLRETNRLTISCLYQKYYPDYISKGRIVPYTNSVERNRSNNEAIHYEVCTPHSFLRALLSLYKQDIRGT